MAECMSCICGIIAALSEVHLPGRGCGDRGELGWEKAEKLQVAVQVHQISPQECALTLDVCVRL